MLLGCQQNPLVAQMVNNLPAMQETQVRARVGKFPWRRGWQLTPVFFPGEFHGQRSLAGYSPQGLKRVRHDLATKQQCMINTITKVCKKLQTNKGAGPDHFNGEFQKALKKYKIKNKIERHSEVIDHVQPSAILFRKEHFLH